jgi:hypothetical protein
MAARGNIVNAGSARGIIGIPPQSAYCSEPSQRARYALFAGHPTAAPAAAAL